MSQKPLCVLLAVSLLVNVLLIGYGLGCAAHMVPPMLHGKPPMLESVNLPPEKKDQIKESMKAFREENRAQFDAIRAKREQIVSILTAPTFDEAAFKQASNELGDLFKDGKQKMVDRMSGLASNMSQNERKELAKFMRRPPPGPMTADNKD